MAYRGVKGSDPFVSKTSRNERFAQMSKQEQIIQQKKLEIQAKMQEQKAKAAVENMKKTNALVPNSIANKANSTKKQEEKPAISQTINLFANDGSFLDQFKKIASNKGSGKMESTYCVKSEEKKEERSNEDTREKERKRNHDKSRDWENRRDRRRADSRWEKNSYKRHSSSSSPSPTRSNTAPESPEARRSFNQLPSNGQRAQHSLQQFLPRNGNPLSVPPTLVSLPIILPTAVPPPNMRNIVTNVPPPNLSRMPPPKNVTNAYPGVDDRSRDPRIQISPSQVIHPPPPPPPPPLQTIPPNTNIPPPNMHISRTIPPNLQNLPPPPPPPPAPSSSSSSLSSSSSSSSSPSPLSSLSSSSCCSTSSSSSSSSTSSCSTSSVLQLPSSLPLSSSSSTSSSASFSLPSLAPSPSGSSSTSVTSGTQQRLISSGRQCGLPPPAALQPTNLPPPNIPPPNLLPAMTQMPPSMMPIPASQTIVVSVPNASNVPNVPPPNVMSPVMMSAPPPVHSLPSSSINSVPPPNLNIPPPNVPPPSIIQNTGPPPPLMSTSCSLPNQVAQVLMLGPPNIQVPPPPARPMAGPQPTKQPEAEQLARIVADCGDEIEQEAREKNAQDPKLWFLHQKQSAAYLQYRGLVAKFRAEKFAKEIKDSGAEPYCPEEALSDNDDSEQSHINKHVPSQARKTARKREREFSGNSVDRSMEENKEERRRKRRSRWGDADNKVVSIADMNNLSAHKRDSGLSQPGIAIPGQIGQPAVIIPSSKVQHTKAKNPMLTKISRNDPALIQYARQTFGTLDLAEEQWKKAEDHYKINLLYQNLLRKREELKRLEAQGKHKYEYDSDEETEGGTWEHKLRSAEMEATQMWAEELTAQAEGKHHIGDFLPPDELDKFMEQYNAVKEGREPNLGDYKEYKLKEDNIGFQMLQKLGWSEGQGLGSKGNGRIEPINKATNRFDSAGLGSERPDGVSRDDDEFDAYRKRMMLAYRFRPNPLNNPRRPYY
ncbi:uncharacterized protein LOC143366945 isoform X2 [Andrena cerasifolii]|uniref:uncharacterized protein LOC143366945 isoform X2 n=1 Tax=Andrena cerasifolii TaxID=2819439 RepID=UPI004037A90B